MHLSWNAAICNLWPCNAFLLKRKLPRQEKSWSWSQKMTFYYIACLEFHCSACKIVVQLLLLSQQQPAYTLIYAMDQKVTLFIHIISFTKNDEKCVLFYILWCAWPNLSFIHENLCVENELNELKRVKRTKNSLVAHFSDFFSSILFQN